MCGCMKRFSSCGCSQQPEARGLSPTLLELMARKQGMKKHWKAQGAGDAIMGTRTKSLQVLDLLVLLLVNCTYLSQTPLTQAIKIVAVPLPLLAAQIPVGSY